MAFASRLVVLLARLATAPVAVSAAVPDPVVISSCVWEEGRLVVRWPAAPGADYYEVQVASATDSQPFGIFSTGAEEAHLDFLLPNSTYHLRLRAHAAGSPSLGPGTWSAVGAAVECRTGATSGVWRVAPKVARGLERTFVMEAMRQSEFTYDVDYLMNHNSGNVLGDAAFLTLSTLVANQSGFLNVTFINATFTLFCLEVLSMHVPGTFSTGGDDRFADYVSCNDINNDKADPQCQCDNWIDRVIGGLDPDLHCRMKNGSTCVSMRGCDCNCTGDSLANSARFTGMMPAYPGTHEDKWQWYSHPKATECTEHEAVGTRRKDGTACTWKRRGDARVLRGWQALAQGWNISSSFHLHRVDPAQVRQNAEVFRKVVSQQPLLPWSCIEPGATAQTQLLV